MVSKYHSGLAAYSRGCVKIAPCHPYQRAALNIVNVAMKATTICISCCVVYSTTQCGALLHEAVPKDNLQVQVGRVLQPRGGQCQGLGRCHGSHSV